MTQLFELVNLNFKLTITNILLTEKDGYNEWRDGIFQETCGN